MRILRIDEHYQLPIYYKHVYDTIWGTNFERFYMTEAEEKEMWGIRTLREFNDFMPTLQKGIDYDPETDQE